MNHAVPGFEVTMHFWIEEHGTRGILVQPVAATFKVQPPAWCQDDPVALELHLEHLARLAFLYSIRKNADLPQYHRLRNRSDYSVNSLLVEYWVPEGHEGGRRHVQYNA